MIDPTRDPYDSAAVERARATLDAVPETIGRYRIRERIGGGGMGEVYVAEQTAPLKRRVALKVIKAGMDTKQVVARFEAERQALAMMDHPNIARVFDAGATETGRPYFVMELVRGVPITQFCDESKLSTRQRVELLVPVCQAVQHAHQKGIIHRDIKPTNVLVTLHDGKPVPKVIDFGIAKATSQPLTDKTVYTEFRAMIGTPAYMSPEQAEMSGLDIDTRSDIYSLGVLMYELLTGTTPFDTTRLVKAGLLEIQRIIKEEEPPRPSLRISSLGQTLPSVAAHRDIEPARLGKLVAGELDWIVMRALEKDRRRRYETANDLAADLERHLAGEPVVAAPPSAAYRIRKFVLKHRTAAVASATFAFLLIAGFAVAIALTRIAQIERSRAESANQKILADQETAKIALGQIEVDLNHDLPKDMASRDPKIAAEAFVTGANAVLRAQGKSDLNEIGALALHAQQITQSLIESKVLAVKARDAAETEAYIANLALAQAAMQADRWPEARERLARCPEAKRGWEWEFLLASAKSIRDPVKFDAGTATELLRTSSDGQFTVSRVQDIYERNRVLVTSHADHTEFELPTYGYSWVGEFGFLPMSQQIVVQLSGAMGSETPLLLVTFDISGRPLGLFGGGWDFYGDVADIRVSPDGQTVFAFSGRRNEYIPLAAHQLDDPVFRTKLFFNNTPLSQGQESYKQRQILEAEWAIESATTGASHAEPNYVSAKTTTQLTVLRRGEPILQMPAPDAFTLAPDGRLFTAERPRTLRIWDANSAKQMMTVQLRSDANRLRFTPDGTRLILDFADDTMEIWDTRDYAARQKDRDARFEEIPAAREYVKKLLATDTPTDQLKDAVRNDASISTLRKLVALEQLDIELRQREADKNHAAATQPSATQP